MTTKINSAVKPGCPTCGKAASEAYRPFCSRRCADVDLQRWLSGAYVVSGTEDDEDQAGGPPEDRD